MLLTKKMCAITLYAALGNLTISSQQQSVPNVSVIDAPPPAFELSEVHIDHDCRVLTQGKSTAANPNPNPHYRYNNVVCHFESKLHSGHTEQIVKNGVPKYVYVSIIEREYLLQNVTGKPVTFVIDQNLPKGWRIDSDPQPTEVTASTATFRVLAQPGQTVRLHVGMRN